MAEETFNLVSLVVLDERTKVFAIGMDREAASKHFHDELDP